MTTETTLFITHEGDNSLEITKWKDKVYVYSMSSYDSEAYELSREQVLSLYNALAGWISDTDGWED